MFRPMIRIIKRDSNVRRVQTEYTLTKTLLGESRWQVFQGKDTTRDLDVAVKIVRGETLRHELRAHKKVQPIIHPHLIRVLDLSVQDGELWVILEYVNPEQYYRLSEISWPADRDRKQLRLIHIALQILDGLAVLASHGLIHDDVKPDNILVKPCQDGSDDGDFARLLDYGSVSSFETQNITKTRFYSQGYSAPDQFPPDNRRDSYSTARVLCELVLGYLPSQDLSSIDKRTLIESAPVLGPILIKALCSSPTKHDLDVEEFANQCREAKRELLTRVAGQSRKLNNEENFSHSFLNAEKRLASVLDLSQKNLATSRQTGELLRKKLKASQRVNRGTRIGSAFSICALLIGLITVSVYHQSEMDRHSQRVELKNREIDELQLKKEQSLRTRQELLDRNFDLKQSLEAQSKKEKQVPSPQPEKKVKGNKTPF